MIYNPPPTSQFLTTAALSNHSHGDPALFLTNLTGTTASNSAGFTLSLSAGAGGAGGGAAISAGANSQNTGTVNFSASNGITFGLSNNGVMTATVKTDYLTTAALSNHSHGVSFTSGSTVFQTLSFTNSNGISFNSGTQGIFGSHNAITTGRASTDAVGLNTAQTNVTWTVNSSGLSFNAGGYAGTGTSATNASVTLNSNGLQISVAAPGGGAGATLSTYHNFYNILTTMSGPSNVSASFVYLPLYVGLTATKIELPVSVTSVATNTNNSSAAILYTLSAYLYTKNGATLNSVSSGSAAATHTWSSNATGSMTGGRFISAAINVNATPGNYFVGLHLSTRATGHTGAATTSLGNTIAMLGVGSAMAGAITFGELGANTFNSAGLFTVGMNSSTGNLTQVSLSNVTQAGSGFQRGNVALRLYL